MTPITMLPARAGWSTYRAARAEWRRALRLSPTQNPVYTLTASVLSQEDVLIRTLISLLCAAAFCLPVFAQTQATQPAARSWIATSNQYANMLIDVVFKDRPESGTQQGLRQSRSTCWRICC